MTTSREDGSVFRPFPWQDSADLPRTVYTDGAPPAPSTSSLKGRQQADILVVGGGLTGLSAALHGASKNMRVIVLEANDLGWGASGRSQGQVVPALQRELEDTEKAFGRERAARLFEAVGNGPEYVFDLIERHKIDCTATRHGIIAAAHSEKALRKLSKRAEFWRDRGQNVEVLDRGQAAELIGSNEYVGGVLDHRGGTINSLAYTRGLGEAAMRQGATLYTRSPALALERDGAAWRVTTPEGEVKAPWVFLCTNAYTGDLWPGLRQSIIPVRAQQIITKPLNENVRRTILPYGHSMADTNRVLIGLRMHPDGRLHCGGSGPSMGADRGPVYGRVRQRLERLFPQMAGFEFEYAWSGWMAMTRDKFPRLHELAPGLLAGLGYSGRGIVMGTLMGRELARRAAGTSLEDLVYPATPMRRLLYYPMRAPIVLTVASYYRALDAWDRRKAAAQAAKISQHHAR